MQYELGKLIEHLQEIQKKYPGADAFKVFICVEPSLAKEFIERSKQKDGSYHFQYEAGMYDVAVSEGRNDGAVIFLPKDF